MPNSKKSLVQSGDMQNYLRTRIGEIIYLNADSRKPFRLQEVMDDYFELAGQSQQGEPGDILIIPIASVVSIQELDTQIGLVIYLVK